MRFVNVYSFVYVLLSLFFCSEGGLWDLKILLTAFHITFLTHQLINSGNKQITDKIYDKSEMCTGQKQRVVTSENPWGVKQYY